MPAIEWFAYNFPNRRSEKPVVEATLDFGPADVHEPGKLRDMVRAVLLDNNILSVNESFPSQALPPDQFGAYASLLTQIAILFQRKAGHPVEYFSVSSLPGQNRVIALMEFHHCDVGLTSIKLAVEVLNGRRRILVEPFKVFRKFALDRLVPLDTQAIIEAARRRDIPAVLLERLPYKREDFDELTRGVCIRPNGMLMLGHGRYQHVFDGTFCLDLSAQFESLRVGSDQRKLLLQKLGIAYKNASGHKTDEYEFQLIAVNGKVTAVIDTGNRCWLRPDIVSDMLLAQVLKLNCDVGFAPMLVRVVSSTPELAENSHVRDFELAPELDRYLEENDTQSATLLAHTADLIIDWVFNKKTQSRMPIVAITGTNGKTTTTRTINHIFQTAGHSPGMVCTDGVFLNGKELQSGDHGTIAGHLKVLTHKEADIAVLETHHAGILKNGFAFSWCDIAICLNVTEDHLGLLNIDTVDQMAEVKGALIERASRAMVLNADDHRCRSMVETSSAKTIGLVSLKCSADELQSGLGERKASCCVLEQVDKEPWVVIYHRGQRLPVMAEAEIPMTVNGTARFNSSNAMHAVLACYLLDLDIKLISSALRTFKTGYELTPGRLNIFDSLPFQVVTDFAHSPDSVSKICDFVDKQPTSGRKILAFSGSTDRAEETTTNIGKAVAGHFDFYFCKEYVPSSGVEKKPVAHLLRRGLSECGVSEDQVAMTTSGKEVIFEIFDACEPGDLLVILVGYVEMHTIPGYIIEYADKKLTI